MKYLSQYQHHETPRVDPFKEIPFDEDETPAWVKWCASIGLVICILVILFI